MGMLRRLFGPSREEVWRQLSAEIEGRYVDGNVWNVDRVQVTHGEWVVTLDTYHESSGKVTVAYTRLRAPFVNPDGFRFAIDRSSVFSGIATRLGMQDIVVGHEPFDADFVVKATDEGRARSLLSSDRLRTLIAAQPTVLLTVKDDEGWFGPTFPEGVDELVFLTRGVIKDVARLKQCYELFAETLDQLCRIGSAYDRAPGVSL